MVSYDRQVLNGVTENNDLNGNYDRFNRSGSMTSEGGAVPPERTVSRRIRARHISHP